MNEFDQTIRELEKDVSRYLDLELLIPELQTQAALLRPQVLALQQIRDAEQQDVDRLESGGIGAVFHKLTGTMDQKLEKERQEANEAVRNYTSAAGELAALEAELEQSKHEFSSLCDAIPHYLQAMEDRIRALEAQSEGAPSHHSLLIQLEKRRRSLREAQLYCRYAQMTASQTIRALDDARSPGAEASQPDLTVSNALAARLLEHLTDLQAKLAQMGIDPEPHLHAAGYLRSPSAYIVGGTSQWSCLERIGQAIEQLNDTQSQLQALSEKLTQALSAIEDNIRAREAEVRKAELSIS